MLKMKMIAPAVFLTALFLAEPVYAWFGMGDKFAALTPENGTIAIALADISDGKAYYYKVKSDKGVMVEFFVLKSRDGIVRAAIDACDVCYRSGKGYVQDGDAMVCENCGMRFASDRINEVKGGCNPAPLARKVENDQLVIDMADINDNAWLCEFRK